LIAIAVLVLFGWLFSTSFASQARGVYVLHTDEREVQAHVIIGHDHTATGMAHYVEHLTWLNMVGAHERSADRHSNAWTNSVAIGYWLSSAPDDLLDSLATLAGICDPLHLPRAFAEQERDIIMREYESRMVGQPDAQAGEAMDAFLYRGNALAASVIGTPEEIKALDYDAARALHAVTHQPENATLVVIGDVTEGQVRRALRQADWPEPQGGRPKIAPPPFELDQNAETMLRYPDANAAARMIWRRVVALPEPLPFDLLEAQTALLQNILGTNLPGGLAGPLLFDAAIARGFDVQIWPIDEGAIEISVRAAPDRGVTLAELRHSFEAALSAIADEGIPEASYERVLGRFNDYCPDWNDEDETARWMADYVLERVSSRREPLTERELKRLEQRLSLTTTNALLHQLAGEGRLATTFIGPEELFK
jgi:hypothetical protein